MISSLYTPFQKWAENGSVWIYSDPHFGDVDAYQLRGLLSKEFTQADIDKLDNMQIANINKKVSKVDTLIILGDIGNIDSVKKLKGYKVLITGNHDKGASYYKRSIKYSFINENGDLYYLDEEEIAQIKSYEEFKLLNIKKEDNNLFDEVYTGCLLVSDKILLSHEPVLTLPSYWFNIHGHDHAGTDFVNFVLKHYDADMPNADMTANYLDTVKQYQLQHLNTCAEWINYTPISLKNIIESGILSTIPTIHKDYLNKLNKKKD